MAQLAVNVQTASGPQEPEYVVVVDPVTGLAATFGSTDVSGLSTEATLAQVYAAILAGNTTLSQQLTELQSSPSYLPPLPLMAPGDFTDFPIDSVANTDITIAAAAGAGIKTRLYEALWTVTGAATTIRLYNDASAAGGVTQLARWDIPSSGGVIQLPFTGRAWGKSQANKPLVLKQTGGAQLSGNFRFAQSAVA